jgi:NAD(P)-dependent dehydrogenase (short-subunit alcohol dehydrogenase family)
MHLENSSFLITGGSSGLGAATAKHLVNNGARVLIADLNVDAGAALAEDLGDTAQFVKTDVCSETNVQSAIATALAKFGGLHGLVNCAGIISAGKILDREGEPLTLAAFQKTVEVNLIGCFNAMRLAAAAMAKNQPNEEGERGVVINTASVAAYDGQMGQAAYAASKAGIAGLTLPLARDLARTGVRVMAIAPGLFETPMLSGLPDEIRESLERQVPFPSRLGRPAEFAQLVQQIIENVMLNGEVIRLDGAIRMAAK